MTIRYTCEECASVLNIKDELAGTQGHCPKCKVEFTIPAAGTEVESAKSRSQPKPAATAPESARSADPLSDDEIEKILGGKATGASGGYGISGRDDDSSDDRSVEELESASARKKNRYLKIEVEQPSEEEEERARQKRRNKEVTPPPPTANAAGIAKDLMAHGGAVEHDTGKAGRKFGAGERDDEEKEFSAADVGQFFLKRAAPIVVGGLLFAGFLYWVSQQVFRRVPIPELGKVTGTVTLNGEPLAKADVLFIPAREGRDANKGLSASAAVTDEKGVYKLKYIEGYAGAVLGKHRIQIRASDVKTGAPMLPVHYNDRTTLTEEVKAGTNTFDFSLSSAPVSQQPDQ